MGWARTEALPSARPGRGTGHRANAGRSCAGARASVADGDARALRVFGRAARNYVKDFLRSDNIYMRKGVLSENRERGRGREREREGGGGMAQEEEELRDPFRFTKPYSVRHPSWRSRPRRLPRRLVPPALCEWIKYMSHNKATSQLECEWTECMVESVAASSSEAPIPHPVQRLTLTAHPPHTHTHRQKER